MTTLSSDDINTHLIVNKLTKDVFEFLSSENMLSDDQLYFITNGDEPHQYMVVENDDPNDIRFKTHTYVNGNRQDLSVVVLTHKEYLQLFNDNELVDGVVYAISGVSELNGCGMPIVNVGEPVLSNDAATKNYVDENFSKCLMRVWREETEEDE